MSRNVSVKLIISFIEIICFSFLRFQLLFRRVDPEQRQDRCLRHTSSRAQDVVYICWQQHCYPGAV